MPTPKPNKTYTNWEALNGFSLYALKCEGYRPIHARNEGCHSALAKIDADTIKRHIAGEHGGGFAFYLQKASNKNSQAIWGDLTTSGLEAQDFRCGCCNAPVRFHPTSLLQHLKPHRGSTKQAYREITSERPGCLGMFYVTLGEARPESTVEDGEEMLQD